MFAYFLHSTYPAHVAAGEVAYAVTEQRFQLGIALDSGAVHGDELCVGEAVKFMSQRLDESSVIVLAQAAVHQMHAGQHMSGRNSCQRCGLIHDVYNATVSAAGQQHHAASLPDKEALLMAERVLHRRCRTQQPAVTSGAAAGACHPSKECHRLVYNSQLATYGQPFGITQPRIQPDVVQTVLVKRKVRLERLLMHEHPSVIVQRQEGPQPTTMIVMTMRYHRQVHIGNAQTKPFSILSEQRTLSHIEQHVSSVLQPNVEAQPMLHRQPHGTGIFH